jgi:hypothetical protein
MVTLCYNPVDGIDINRINNDITIDTKQIIIFNELEWELKQLTPEFVEYIKGKNIDIKIIFGGFFDQYYIDYADNLGLSPNDLIFWNTYWINWSEQCLKSSIDYANYNVNTDFKYPFICLNNRNHIHRAALIDHLTKYNLLDTGIVTWHKFSNHVHGYQFKYYDDTIRTIDDDFSTKLDSFLIPKQWHESFLHVVGESTINVNFITEKSIIPILLKKPFVSIAKQGFNKKLIGLGFLPYDEIIDYSFDDEPDIAKRADILCNSISKIGTDYTELYNRLLPKIEYNYNRCLEIIRNINFIPSVVIDRVNQMKNVDYIPMHTDPRYERMVNECKNI